MDISTSSSTIFNHLTPPQIQNPSRSFPRINYSQASVLADGSFLDTKLSFSSPLLAKKICDYFSDHGKINSLSLTKQIHAHVLKLPNKEKNDEIVMDLMSSYLRFCDYKSAVVVFFVGFGRNFLLWRWFLEEFRCFGGDPIEIIRVFGELYSKGVDFDSRVYTVVLKICAILMDGWLGVEVHGCLIKKGFDLDVHLKCALMNFYGKCWGSDYADKVFDEMSTRDDPSLWNEVIVAALQSDRPVKALQLFQEMQSSSVKAESFTIAKALQACGKGGALDEGRQIHGYVYRKEMEKDVAICNSLITMYSKNQEVELARNVFESMESCNASTWNSMISAYASLGNFAEAMELFDRMKSSSVKPDVVTWNCLLSSHLEYGLVDRVLIILHDMVAAEEQPNASSITPAIQAVTELKWYKLGKEIHSYVLRHGLDLDLYIQSTLLDMYVKTGELVKAQAMFNLMKTRNIVAWNSLVAGYASKGLFNVALKLLNQMDKEGLKPDVVTWNTLLAGFSLNGRVQDAFSIIDKMTSLGVEPNVISWTALVSGCSQNGKLSDSLSVFRQMLEQDISPNSATISSLLQAIAGLSWLQKGQEIHCWCVRNGFDLDVSVATALIQMYIKSGSLHSATEIFHTMKNKTVATLNCMIMGLAVYNCGKEGIMLFDEMLTMGIHPDAITFTALLSCCKNSGLVEEGWKFFDSMETDYNITPTIKHYSCMIDLLGKAGYLEEALDLIETMPVEPDASVWGSLLQSCRVHKNLNLGKIAARYLFELEPDNSANYVMMMNLYSMSDRWEDVDRLKEQFTARGLKVQIGWSWIQINNVVHNFSDENPPHPETRNIYSELRQLISEIKKSGYIPDLKSVYQDIDNAAKEKLLLTHTEKLAITYGLMKTRNGSPIRVIKNTRMCSDCHIAAKYMSLVRNRKIILKDGVRFHHFQAGKCSCNDCW